MFSEVDIYYFTLPVNILSFLGSLFVIFLYALAKPLRVYAFKLVFWVCFYDIFYAAILLIPIFDLDIEPIACNILSFILVFSTISSSFWILAIAISMYQVLVIEKSNIEKYYKIWFFTIMVYSIIVSSLPIFTDSYGIVALNCTFKENLAGNIYKFSTFYGPIWIEVFVISILYLIIFFNYSRNSSSLLTSTKISIKRLILFPLILGFCVLPSTINRALQAFDINSNIVYFLGEFILCLRGFLNAVVYALTDPVKIYLRNLFKNNEDIALISL
jgi:Slime mold cyclic AMP receptor